MPSFLSSVPAQSPKSEASSDRPSSWLVSKPLLTASSEYFTASGALEKICFRIASARVIKSVGRHDFVNESDAIGFLRADHLSGKNELKRATFPDQPRQTLCSAAARNHSQFHFGLTELRVLSSDSNRASHGCFASATKREAIHRGDHGLAEIFDKIENTLSKRARLLALQRR